MKAIPVALLLVLLVAAASLPDLVVAADNAAPVVAVPVPDGVCDGKCRSRCSLKKGGRCMGLCMMCCRDCKGCVPSGPYASKDGCPCYRDKKSPRPSAPSAPSRGHAYMHL